MVKRLPMSQNKYGYSVSAWATGAVVTAVIGVLAVVRGKFGPAVVIVACATFEGWMAYRAWRGGAPL
jgi:hypothetical protein